MSISRTMYKRETVKEVGILIFAGMGEITAYEEDEETGKSKAVGKKEGVILRFKNENDIREKEFTHSNHERSGLWKLIQECYGHKAAKKAIEFDNDGYAVDVDYFFSLVEYLQGQKFEQIIETGKFTRVKDITLIGEIELPTKEAAAKRIAHLEKSQAQAKAAAKEAFGDYPDKKPEFDSNPDDFDADEVPF